MQNLDVTGCHICKVHVKSSARAPCAGALSPCMMHAIKSQSESHLRKICRRKSHPGSHPYRSSVKSSHLKFTSESHPKSHPCRIHSLPGATPSWPRDNNASGQCSAFTMNSIVQGSAVARCRALHPRARRSGPWDGGREARSAWTALRCKIVQLYSCIATSTVRIASLSQEEGG